MNPIVTVKNKDGEIVGQFDAHAWAEARKPYRGISKLTTHAWLKPGYRAKNAAGGLKCTMTHAKGY